MSMGDNHVDLWAYLHANNRSVDQTTREITEALRKAGRDGSEGLAKAIEDATPRVRKAFNRVTEATVANNRAEREANEIREQGVKITMQRLQLEADRQELQRKSLALQRVELAVGERLVAMRKQEDRALEGVAQKEERVAAARAKANAINDYVKGKNADLRGKRKLRANLLNSEDGGDRQRAAALKNEIAADDLALEPARKKQMSANRELRESEADLASGRNILNEFTAESKRTEEELNTVRNESKRDSKELARIESDLTKTRDAQASITKRQTRADEDAITSLNRRKEALTSLHEAEEAERKRSEQSSRKSGRGGRRGRGDLDRAAGSVGSVFTDIPFVPGGPAGALIGSLVVSDMVSLAEGVTTAAQSIALLPAVAAAGGAAMGTLAIATHGFGDAIKHMGDPKKFAEALQSLSPTAQQAALEVKKLVDGPLGQLKTATQEAFFRNAPTLFERMSNQFTPTIQKMTTGIATAFNGMFSNLVSELQTPGAVAGIDVTVDNIVKAFQNLQPAVAPFVDAIGRLVQVGSTFLPGFGNGITDLVKKFDDFITKAQADGSLKEFMQKGIDAAAILGKAIWTLGQELFNLFGNKSPDELRASINNVVNDIKALIDIVVDVAHLIREWKDEIVNAAIAFGAFKVGGAVFGAVKGLAELLGITGVGGALKALPGIASGAGGGITAALAAIQVPQWLTFLMKWGGPMGVGLQSDQKFIGPDGQLSDKPSDTMKLPDGRVVKLDGNGNPVIGADGKVVEAVGGGGGSFAEPGKGMPAIPGFGQHWDPKTGWTADSPGHGMPAAPGFGQKWDPKLGWVPEDAPGTMDVPAVPGPKPTQASEKERILSSLNPDSFMPDLSQILPNGVGGVPSFNGAPAGAGVGGPGFKSTGPLEIGTNGMPFQKPALGYDVTDQKQIFDKEWGVVKAAQDLRDAKMELAATEQSGLASAWDLHKAKEKVAQQEHDFTDSQLELQSAYAGKWKKAGAGLNAIFGEIGANLDKDLGLSKGLPGLADNLVKFVASLAAAPLMGMLAPIAAQGDPKSYGALGMMFGGNGQSGSVSQIAGNMAVQGAAGVPGYSTRSGAYPGDQALLSNVPVGHYEQTQAADLTKGIGDCTSSIEDLVNIMDGKSTAGRSLSTNSDTGGAAATWLNEHGFVQGVGGPGDFRVGYNAGHMQATLPGGTPFNWGSDAAAANRGIGGTGADDPSFTSHYFRPTGSGVGSPIVNAPAPTPSAPAYAAPPATPSIPGGGAAPGALQLPAVSADQVNAAAAAGPGLTNPLPPPGSLPGGGGGPGGPLGNFPNGAGLGGPPLSPANISTSPSGVPYQAQGIDFQPGWQPQGGGGIGVGGGLAGAAIQGGASMFGGPAGGAAAQTAMQAINRTTKFAGQAAGILAEGALDTFFPTNPDTGKNPMKDSWFWRAAGSLAGAAPAIGAGGAGLMDKAANKKNADNMAPGQGGDQQQQNPQGGPLLHIENWNGGDQGAKGNAIDLAANLQAQTNEAVLPRA